MDISILDYGASNLKSVKKAFEYLGCSVSIITTPEEVEKAERLIFPGQGAFGPSIEHLTQKQLIDPIKHHIYKKRPFFGICLGFQLLFSSSEEAPEKEGLSIFPGHFKKFQSTTRKVPHMGWNALELQKPSQLLASIDPESYVYFVHSYYLENTTPDIISSTTQYCSPFVSSIESENVWGTQFHPEKSSSVGIQILKNFISFCNS